MNRLLFTAIVALLIAFNIEVLAQKVSRSKAQGIAAKFMNERQMGAVDASKTVCAPRSDGKVASESGDAAYYVFNAKGDKGFVIVSGDERAKPILGYSDHGSFDYDNMPAAMKCWFDQYAAEIDMLDQEPVQQFSAPKSTNSVLPFIKTQWGQENPFNVQCPELNGEYCLVGSMATAMAQVMYYYRLPNIFNSLTINGYTTTTNHIQVPVLYATPLNWDAMKLYYEYYSDPTDASSQAVAKLMRLSAQVNKSDFDLTYTKSYNLIDRYVNWLQFSHSARTLWRTDYSKAQWENFILTELQAKRPVLYVAETHDIAHAFLCDGYDGNGYYHINWGLRGWYDGYYQLSTLDPAITNMPYHYNLMLSHRIVIGLEPSSSGTTPRNDVAEVISCTANSETYTRGSSGAFAISLTASQKLLQGSLGGRYDMSWGIFDEGGFHLRAVYGALISDTLISANQIVTFKRNLNFGKNYPDGTYYLRPLSRQTGNTGWFPSHNSGIYYIRAVIQGNTLTLSRHNITPEGITAWISSYSAVRARGSLLDVTVQVTNNSRMNQEIPLYMYHRSNYNNVLELVGGTTINVPAGSHGYTTITYVPLYKGTDNIYITSSKDFNPVQSDISNWSYCEGSVYIDNFHVSVLEITNRVLNADENNVIDGNTFKVETTVKNQSSEGYHNYIIAELYKVKNKEDWSVGVKVSELKKSLLLNGYESNTNGPLTFSFENLKPGYYHVRVSYLNYNDNFGGTYKKYAAGTFPHRVGGVPGDVNGDGFVTSADVTAVYDVMLGTDLTFQATADVNGDGYVTSADVTMVYDIMLGN